MRFECIARCPLFPGSVYRQLAQLAAGDAGALDHRDLQARLRQLDGRGQPTHTSAHDYHGRSQ